MSHVQDTANQYVLSSKWSDLQHQRLKIHPTVNDTVNLIDNNNNNNNQALQTNYYATKILNTETDSKCRLCQQFDQTIDHIISACPLLAKVQYIKRHDRVCAQLHFNICKETGVKLDQKKTLVWTCAKISRNKSMGQGNHIVESTSTNWQNYPQQLTRHYNPW